MPVTIIVNAHLGEKHPFTLSNYFQKRDLGNNLRRTLQGRMKRFDVIEGEE